MSTQIHIEKGIPIPRQWPEPKQIPEGFCLCGKAPKRPNRQSCAACGRAAVESNQKAYVAKRAKGLCGYGACPEKAAEGHVSCSVHLEKTSTKIRALLGGRLAAGLCRRCGQFPIVGTKTWCLRCYPVCGGGASAAPKSAIPPAVRRVVRQFWRMDRIDQRRALAEEAIALIRDERVRDVLSLRHGLVDGIDHSLDSVGKKYGVTRERIRQIETKAYDLLDQLGVVTKELRKPSERQVVQGKGGSMSPAESKKERARRALREAVRRGEIKKQPCHKCGRQDSSAHHWNYDRPLDVIWVCPPHHAESHGKTIRNEQPKRYVFPAWLERVAHSSNDLYDGPMILETLKRLQIPQGVASNATGLQRQTLVKLVRGEFVDDADLLTMLRYIETFETRESSLIT